MSKWTFADACPVPAFQPCPAGRAEEERWLLFFFMDDVNFTALHYHMFVPAIEGQASEAQQREWLPKAKALHWIGCYAQTEMGHGSNVQGLETTATFVPEADAWEIHSPTLTSTKARTTPPFRSLLGLGTATHRKLGR